MKQCSLFNSVILAAFLLRTANKSNQMWQRQEQQINTAPNQYVTAQRKLSVELKNYALVIKSDIKM